MLGFGTKNYNSIVAPLKKIESDLSTYIGNQNTNVQNLEKQKEEIDVKIGDSKLEIRKSEHTVAQISALLAVDFDGDGEPDFVEPPAEETEEK